MKLAVWRSKIITYQISQYHQADHVSSLIIQETFRIPWTRYDLQKLTRGDVTLQRWDMET